MEDKEEKHQNNGSGGILGLVLVIALGWWVYNHYLQPTDKPWWNGTQSQRVCVVHDPSDSSCYTTSVTVEDGRITSLSLPDGGTAIISMNDCGKAETEGGLAGKGNRYCVISEIAGGREWQVSER